jgi:hypothetical protein
MTTPKEKIVEIIDIAISNHEFINPRVRREIAEDAFIGIALYFRDISPVDLETFLDQTKEEIV